MLRNHLVTALRSLRRHLGFTTINVVGLGVGIAVSILLLLFVRSELAVNDVFPNAERIYRIDSWRTDGSSGLRFLATNPVGETMAREAPGVQARTWLYGIGVTVGTDGDYYRRESFLTNSGFFDIFDLPLRHGNPETALDEPRSAVLRADVARTLFGTTDVVGRTIDVKTYRHGSQPYTVTGVWEKLPNNSVTQFRGAEYKILLSEGGTWDFAPKGSWSQWQSPFLVQYVRLAEKADVGDLRATIDDLVAAHAPDDVKETLTVGLNPLTEVYLTRNDNAGWQRIYLVALLAGLVLLIAGINFTNLATAHSLDRVREVGVRKTVGALRGQLMAQFWSEAFLLCTAALGLGLALAALFHPVFQRLVSAPLPPIEWTDPVLLGLLGGLLLVVGLVAGSYPAVYLSRFRPTAVLRGTEGIGRPPRLVQGLVVVQFALAVGLVVGTFVMVQQMDLLQSKSLGYESEQVVRLSVPEEEGAERWKQLRTALADETRVQHVAGSWNPLGGGDGVSFNSMRVAVGGGSIGVEDDGDFKALTFGATPTIVETLGLDVVMGQSFAELGAQMGDNVVLVNRAFVEAAGWDEPLGRRVSVLFGVGNARVVGVVDNFHARSLHHEIQPLVITLDSPVTTLYARLAPGNIQAGMDRLRAAWERTMPDLPFQYTFLDDAVERQYRAEQRWARTIRYGAGFALFIACLGLLGLTQLVARRRTQEIGLRRVLGASVVSIVGRLTRDFMTWVAVAFAMAVPLSYWAAQQWLQRFAYRIDLGPWLFLGAGGLVAVVAFITVGIQAWRAARIDPATTLRDE